MFLAINCPSLRACHDSVAFAMSTQGKKLVQIPDPYYLLTDSAYKVFDSVLVPFEGKSHNTHEQNFNFFQSSLRMNIEC